MKYSFWNPGILLWPGSAAASAVGQRQAQSQILSTAPESMMHLPKTLCSICNISHATCLGLDKDSGVTGIESYHKQIIQEFVFYVRKDVNFILKTIQHIETF